MQIFYHSRYCNLSDRHLPESLSALNYNDYCTPKEPCQTTFCAFPQFPVPEKHLKVLACDLVKSFSDNYYKTWSLFRPVRLVKLTAPQTAQLLGRMDLEWLMPMLSSTWLLGNFNVVHHHWPMQRTASRTREQTGKSTLPFYKL